MYIEETQITIYTTSDGQEFRSRESALSHAKKLELASFFGSRQSFDFGWYEANSEELAGAVLKAWDKIKLIVEG
jgi:hypothetical protein